MNEAENAAGRLKRVLLTDKIKAASSLEEVVKSDVFHLLENYFESVPESMDMRLSVDENGLIDIKIAVKAMRAKNSGIVLK
jgi:septum formation topological specificity factor MinE